MSDVPENHQPDTSAEPEGGSNPMSHKEDDLQTQVANLREEVSVAMYSPTLDELGGEPLDIERALFYLWMTWADFHLTITWPVVKRLEPPILHLPKELEDGQVENVFTIVDSGSMLSTSRGEDAFVASSGLSKYYNTIDKMIRLLLDKLKEGGVGTEDEVRVAFRGFDLGCRKAFEAILNLEENVLVVNYDPGRWGDLYMKNILEMVERGYGMPKTLS
jgi:hypothetical protein